MTTQTTQTAATGMEHRTVWPSVVEPQIEVMEWVKLIRKLRWIGMHKEAAQLEKLMIPIRRILEINLVSELSDTD
jgi:hypothetical protein